MATILKKELIEEIAKSNALIKEIQEKKIIVEKKDSFLFQRRKENYVITTLKNSLKKISNKAWDLGLNCENKEKTLEILKLSLELDKFNLDKIILIEKNIKNLNDLILQIQVKNKELMNDSLIPSKIKVPSSIIDEVNSDLYEMKKCFSYSLYKSTVILCGRILEVSLHKKYFDLTGHDILDTQPGIGLGKLVAKLSEKNVKFDPGINEQIHLINKIRIQSVHKKEDHFIPTKEQSYATILYTLDIVKKLFN